MPFDSDGNYVSGSGKKYTVQDANEQSDRISSGSSKSRSSSSSSRDRDYSYIDDLDNLRNQATDSYVQSRSRGWGDDSWTPRQQQSRYSYRPADAYSDQITRPYVRQADYQSDRISGPYDDGYDESTVQKRRRSSKTQAHEAPSSWWDNPVWGNVSGSGDFNEQMQQQQRQRGVSSLLTPGVRERNRVDTSGENMERDRQEMLLALEVQEQERLRNRSPWERMRDAWSGFQSQKEGPSRLEQRMVGAQQLYETGELERRQERGLSIGFGTPQGVYNTLAGVIPGQTYEESGVTPYVQTAAKQYYDQREEDIEREFHQRQLKREYNRGAVIGPKENPYNQWKDTIEAVQRGEYLPEQRPPAKGLGMVWQAITNYAKESFFEGSTIDPETGNWISNQQLREQEGPSRFQIAAGNYQDWQRKTARKFGLGLNQWWQVAKSTPIGDNPDNPSVGELLSATMTTANLLNIFPTPQYGPIGPVSEKDQAMIDSGLPYLTQSTQYGWTWKDPLYDAVDIWDKEDFSTPYNILNKKWQWALEAQMSARTITDNEMLEWSAPYLDLAENVTPEEISLESLRRYNSTLNDYRNSDSFEQESLRRDETEKWLMLNSASMPMSVEAMAEDAWTAPLRIQELTDFAEMASELATNPNSPLPDDKRGTLAIQATLAGIEIQKLKSMGMPDFVDKHEDIGRDVLISLIGDPLNIGDLFTSAASVTPKARRLLSAVEEVLPAPGAAGDLGALTARAGKEAVEELVTPWGGHHGFTLAESRYAEAIGLDVNYVRNNAWQIAPITAINKAALDARAMHGNAVYLFKDVDNIVDAKNILRQYIEDPFVLMNEGMQGLTSVELRKTMSVDGVNKWRSGHLITPQADEARQSLAIAADELLSMPNDTPFNLRDWVALVDDATNKGGMGRRGVLRADVPVRADDVKVVPIRKNARDGDEAWNVRYYDKNGEAITSSRNMTRTEARKAYTEIEKIVKQSRSAADPNRLEQLGRLQKQVFSTMWLDLRPANWVKQSVSGVMHATFDGVQTFHPTQALDAWWAKILNDDALQPTYRLATEEGMFGRHMGGKWDGRNPVSKGINYLREMWTGDTAILGNRWGVGETNNVKRPSMRAGQEAQRQYFTQMVDGQLDNLVATTDMDPAIAKNFLNTLVDMGTTGGKADLIDSFMKMVGGEGIPLTLRDLGDDLVGGLSTNGFSRVVDLFEAADLNNIDDVIRQLDDIFLEDQSWLRSVRAEVPRTVGRTTYSSLDDFKDLKEASNGLADAGRRANIPVSQVDTITQELAKGRLDARNSLNRVLKEAPRTVDVLPYYRHVWDELEAMKMAAREAQREAFKKLPPEVLTRGYGGLTPDAVSAAWREYFDETANIWRKYNTQVDEYIPTVAGELDAIGRGENITFSTSSSWDRIERLAELDEDAIAEVRAREIGSVLDEPEDAWREQIQANRDYVDLHSAKTYDVSTRYFTPDAIDLIVDAEKHVESIGDIAAGLRADAITQLLEGKLSHKQYLKTRNRLWREAADTQAAIWNVTTQLIIDKHYANELAQMLQFEHPVYKTVQIIKRVNRASGSGWADGAEIFHVRTPAVQDMLMKVDNELGVPEVVARNYDTLEKTVRAEAQEVADNVFSGTNGIRKTKPGEGWKIHIPADPDNYDEINDYLTNQGYKYKNLQGGTHNDGKDFTVYIGSRTDVENAAKQIESDIGNLIAAPPKGGDVTETDEAFGKLWIRFEVIRGPRKRSLTDTMLPEFHQYGPGGISLLQDDVIQRSMDSMTGNPWTQAQVDEAIERAKARAYEIYGDDFMPRAATAPQSLSITPDSIRETLGKDFEIPTAYTRVGQNTPRFTDKPALNWIRSKGITVADDVKSLDALPEDTLQAVGRVIRLEAEGKGLIADDLAVFRAANPTKVQPDTVFDWLSMQNDTVNDLVTAAREREKLLLKTQGLRDLTTGDIAEYYAETGRRLRARLIEKLRSGTENVTTRPLELSPDQKAGAIRWFYDNVAPAYDESVLAAIEAAEKMASFTMIDYTSGRYIDSLLSPFIPYHFWGTRSGKNWMERAMTNPSRIALFSRYKNGIERDRVRDELPDRYQNTVPLFNWQNGEYRIQEPIQSLFTPFLTDYYMSDYGDVDRQRGAFSTFNQSMSNLGFGTYPWQEAAGLWADGRADEIAPLTWIPLTQAAYIGTQAISGKILPGSPHYQPYLVSRSLWGFVAGGEMSVDDALLGQAVANDIATGHSTIDDDNERARDYYTVAAKEAGRDLLLRLVTRFFTGLGVSRYDKNERLAQQQANLIKDAGWNQFENPSGSQLAVDELRREFPSYETYLGKNNTLPNDREWMYTPKSAQYIGPLTWGEAAQGGVVGVMPPEGTEGPQPIQMAPLPTFDGDMMKPAFIRGRWLQRTELDAEYRNMNNEMDKAIQDGRAKGLANKDINEQIGAIYDKYRPVYEEIRERYAFAAWPDDYDFGPNEKLNPHESAFDAVMNTVGTIESDLEEIKPERIPNEIWDKMSRKQKAEQYKKWEVYNETLYEEVKQAMNDMSTIVKAAGGRPLDLMEVQTLLDVMVDKGTPLDVDAETMQRIIEAQALESREPLQDKAGIYPVEGDLAEAAIKTEKYQHDTPTQREFRIEYDKEKDSYRAYSGTWRSGYRRWGRRWRRYYRRYRRRGRRWRRRRYYSRRRRGGRRYGRRSYRRKRWAGYGGGGGRGGADTLRTNIRGPQVRGQGLSPGLMPQGGGRDVWRPSSMGQRRVSTDIGPDPIRAWRKMSG
jgi:hypothetical protein